MKGYTLAQVNAFSCAAGKLQRQRMSDLLFVVRVADADKQDYKRIQKALTSDD